MKQRSKNIYWTVFLIYLGALVWILFNRRRYTAGVPYLNQMLRHLNLRPFQTIRLYLRLLLRPIRPVHVKLALYNLLGNLFLFCPMGVLLPVLFPKFRSFSKTIVFVLAIVISAEILQVLLLAGSCDVDDVILNLLGAGLGYGLYKLLNL